MWVYIWKEEQEWQPGENTLLYLPMTEDFIDHWPNSLSLTNRWVSLVQNQANVGVWYFNGSSDILWAYSSLFSFGNFHLGAWVKYSQINVSQFIFAWVSNSDLFIWYLTYWGDNRIWIGRNGIAWDSVVQHTLSTDTWYYISYDRNWSTLTISLNWTSLWAVSSTISYGVSWQYNIGNDGTGFYTNWYMSDIIFEKVAWGDTEITNYYNLTKSNYWL